MAITGGGSGQAWDLLVETAYDRAVEYALRDEPTWRAVVDTKPAHQAMPGEVVTMSFIPDMALAVTPLNELTDVTPPGQAPPTRVNITLNEYGNADNHTERLRQLAFTNPDPELAEVIGRNQVDSLDAVIRAIVDPSNFVLYAGGIPSSGTLVSSNTGDNAAANNAILATWVASARTVTAAVTLLRRRKVNPRASAGGMYLALAHPDVLFDLMTESPSSNAWILPHAYVDTENVYRGEVGTYQGARYISTTRITSANNTGSVKVYSTYFLGQQAVAEAVGGNGMGEPKVVIGNQTDLLKRFYPIGWKALIGWNIYRQEAIERLRTSSSLQALV
jgi:N4-gp56 family major capsid protein